MTLQDFLRFSPETKTCRETSLEAGNLVAEETEQIEIGGAPPRRNGLASCNPVPARLRATDEKRRRRRSNRYEPEALAFPFFLLCPLTLTSLSLSQALLGLFCRPKLFFQTTFFAKSNFHNVLSLQAASQISMIFISQILKYVFTCTMQN